MKKNSKNTRYLIVLSLKFITVLAVFILVYTYTFPLYNSVKNFFVDETVKETRVIILDGTAITVEVADTHESRIRGLSSRTELKEGRGMLFVFEKADTYGFWMRDMNFAIDIIWFDQYGEVIYIKENATPDSYPETFTPPSPALYVLEVPAGFTSLHSINLGDKIDFY